MHRNTTDNRPQVLLQNLLKFNYFDHILSHTGLDWERCEGQQMMTEMSFLSEPFFVLFLAELLP